MATDEVKPGRIPGCESTNHKLCYGELWQCSRCGKTVCSAEGSDEDPDLCDDCWYAKHYADQDTADDGEASRSRGPAPTTPVPDLETLELWLWDDVVEATDGCICEPDGICPHGYPSWLIELGLI